MDWKAFRSSSWSRNHNSLVHHLHECRCSTKPQVHPTPHFPSPGTIPVMIKLLRFEQPLTPHLEIAIHYFLLTTSCSSRPCPCVSQAGSETRCNLSTHTENGSCFICQECGHHTVWLQGWMVVATSDTPCAHSATHRIWSLTPSPRKYRLDEQTSMSLMEHQRY